MNLTATSSLRTGIALSAEQLQSASVKAGSLQLSAGRDLLLQTATQTSVLSRAGANANANANSVTRSGPAASIVVAGNARLDIGGDFAQK